MSEIAAAGWHLENHQPGHDKFYTVIVTDNGAVSLSWGRNGTRGQSKVQKFPTRADAESVALRQVYAKQAKGYEPVQSNVKFLISDAVVTSASRASDASGMVRELHRAMREPQYEGHKRSVLTHYDEFVAKAQSLMSKAASMPFEAVYAEFEELRDSWAEIAKKHDEAAVTIGLTEQMLFKSLMEGGAK